MSIYGSIQPDSLCQIPARDWYTGEIVENQPTSMVDVAVAQSWHNCIRLSLRSPDNEALLLTIDEVALLIETLIRATQAVTR